MNRIDNSRYNLAFELFWDNYSIREVCQIVAIARETAHRIQKEVRESYAQWGEGDLPTRTASFWEKQALCAKEVDIYFTFRQNFRDI
jgi:hypothetical protein